MVKVSVVMAVFNCERFISYALNSILTQSFTDFELIVIDDGSTDSSPSIVHNICAGDKRARVITRSHLGLVSSLNLGCSLATGEYIARLDADDVAAPNRLTLQYDFMQKHKDVSLSGGYMECIDASGRVSCLIKWPSRLQNLSDLQLLDCHIAHTTVMFRRHIFEQLGAYRSEYLHAEDYDLFLRMSDTYQLDNLPAVLSQYRLHDQQLSAVHTRQQIISGIGARLATRARRSGRAEPTWKQGRVTQDALHSLGISERRIEKLVLEYDSHLDRLNGWRWRTKAFCELIPSDSRQQASRG